jgi:hypothetical protein
MPSSVYRRKWAYYIFNVSFFIYQKCSKLGTVSTQGLKNKGQELILFLFFMPFYDHSKYTRTFFLDRKQSELFSSLEINFIKKLFSKSRSLINCITPLKMTLLYMQ